MYDVANEGGTALTLNSELNSENLYNYVQETGVVTISESTDIVANKIITITVEGVALSADATLSALTYSNPNISSGSSQNVPSFSEATIPDITLEYNKNLESSIITMVGTPTNANAKITSNDGATINNGEATVTVSVTAEDRGTTKDYVVKFKVANDKLSSITVPEIILTEKVSVLDDVLAILNAVPYNRFSVVTVGSQEDVTIPVTWTYEGQGFDATAESANDFTWTVSKEALAGKKLDQNGVDLTGTVSVSNPAAIPSTDATLSVLTYSVSGGEAIEITGFSSNDNSASQDYLVALPSSTSKDAIITVVAKAADKKAVIVSDAMVGQLNENRMTITFTVTPESGEGAKRIINITFERANSHIITLSSLKYKIGDGEEKTVDGFNPEDDKGIGYNVKLPFGTPANAVITVIAIPTDESETIIPEDRTVTLSEGYGRITLHVGSEDGSGQNITIVFAIAKEKIISVIAPKAPELTKAMTADEVVAEVQKIVKIAVTSEGATLTELPVTWKLKGEFTDKHGAKNTYLWTITPESYALYDINDQPTTGEMDVINYIDAVTGNLTDVTINSDNPYTQIGGEDKATTVENVTVSTTVDKIAFDNVEVSGAVTVNQTVPSITLNNATISEITLASSQSTTLILQSGNIIEQITNEGTMTLKDATAVAPRSMILETRAAVLANQGDVKTVDNNGTFTDETATIVAVGGKADLSITALPKDQSTTGSSATLTVAAESTKGAVSYKWQKYTTKWETVSGTEASLKIDKTQDGSTKYRCEMKSTNSGASAATILYTPAVTVTFRTGSEPSEPSNPSTPTYTVSFDKVAGATFSKGEKTTVDAGDNFSFKITLDKDYDQSKPIVTVDGKAITADADGSYTIKNIQTDIKIVVSGIVKNTATGIEDTVEDAARAWTVGSTLYIHVPETSDVYVVSGTGALQQQLRGVSGDYNMQLRVGFYIVRIGEVSQKVIIR